MLADEEISASTRNVPVDQQTIGLGLVARGRLSAEECLRTKTQKRADELGANVVSITDMRSRGALDLNRGVEIVYCGDASQRVLFLRGPL